MKNIVSNKYLRFSLILIGGVFLGWILFHSSDVKEVKKEYPEEIAKATIWTCAMHPQIKMPEPGKCPIWI
jgi:Cu(I)/Ag(I) efflux system membrane fusion protein